MYRFSQRASRLCLVAVAASALAGCGPGEGDSAPAAPPGRLTGTVLYRERMALPPDAIVKVRLEDVSRADAPADVLVEQMIPTAGKQVPIPFELRYDAARVEPNRRYGVRAEIRDPTGGLMFTTTTQHEVTFASGQPTGSVEVLVERAGRSPPPPEAAPAPTAAPETPAGAAAAGDGAEFPQPGRTFVFDCDGDLSFIVRSGPGEVALWVPAALGGRYTVLSHTPAASGARYQEGDTVYWNRGELAMFEVDGRRFVDCKSNPAKVPWADAKRRGVTLRALGNEPAWSFEVQGRDLLILVTDLGAMRTELPYSPPTVAGARTSYVATNPAHMLAAVVERTPCVDTMSGEAFEAAVSVTLDGKTMRGCGRFL